MKSYYTPLIAATVSAIICFAATIIFPGQWNTDQASFGGPESPSKMKEWEHMKYADPATGRIPSQALWKAYRELIEQGYDEVTGRRFYKIYFDQEM